MPCSRLLRAVAILALFASACSVQRWQPARGTALDDHSAHMNAADIQMPAIAMRSGSVQGTPGIPAGAQDVEARLKTSSRHAEWVKIAWEPGSRDSLMAWIVYPEIKTKAPVIVVVHEIFGLQAWVRGVADQLAADGFIAIAPDLISRVRGGPSTTELSGDSARKLIVGVDYTERNKGVSAAAAYAMTLPAAEKRYGVVGYCWGGSTAFSHAIANGKGLGAAVAYYGLPYINGAVPNADSLAKIKVPMMLLNGSNDARIGAAMPALDSMMKALGKNYSGKNYDGAAHGFLRAQEQPANLTAAKDAWPMTIAFFRKNLAVK